MLAPLGSGTWRCDIQSVGWRKPRSLEAKVALMEKFDELLWGLEGEVSLKAPEHVIALLEDFRPLDANNDMEEEEEEEEVGMGGGAVEKRMEDDDDIDSRCVSAPSCLFIGRQLATGAASHLHTFSLSRRPYLGRTTLPPALALLMANQARVVEGSLVLDPFCGTCSTLLSCAARGAITVGVEVDERVLHGGEGGRGIYHNFEDAHLEPPAKLLLGDAARLDEPDMLPVGGDGSSRFDAFDAIVTDPPYGLMEGLGELYVPLRARLESLLRLAARRLKLGGRLVFLLPLPAGAAAEDALPDDLPTARCLEVENISRQRISLKMDRLMVTMCKVAEPRNADEGRRLDREVEGGLPAAVATTSVELGQPAAPWERWWVDGGAGDSERAAEAPRSASPS